MQLNSYSMDLDRDIEHARSLVFHICILWLICHVGLVSISWL